MCFLLSTCFELDVGHKYVSELCTRSCVCVNAVNLVTE